jgi:coenzyme F420 hydrogenase subunit beta
MSPSGTTASVGRVVASDLCIGCGLCEAVTNGRVTMMMTPAGSLRPSPVDGFTAEEEAAVLAACPGVVAEAREDSPPARNLVWGGYRSMAMAWAADPEIRFAGSSGGVLTALGGHLLQSGRVAFVLHVGPDPERPSRTRWVISETPDAVLANTGSRYGPTAPLAGLSAALDRCKPFAIIAKPCDLGAVHRYAAVDPRVDELCIVRLALVCGGQSRLTKTTALLDRFGIAESDVAKLRYRGNGNPGSTHVSTVTGETHEATYLEMWGDEAGWDLETRCKLCPDSLGECADVAALDTWPGGAPTGEDAGFNAIVVRTATGAELVAGAADAGELEIGDALGPAQLDDFQPHQVRKKRALASRYEGVALAGVEPIETIGLRVDELGAGFTGDRDVEREGSRRRMEAVARP